MPFRYDEIGQRLKAFRLGSGLSADEVARSIGISRTALYRFEKGELAKIETIERLAELLEVSIPTLLGVGIEYVSSAVSYFERIRQIEETAEHIIVLAGPISYLLSSDPFQSVLEEMLRESIPPDLPTRERALADVAVILEILQQRKETYRKRRPGIVNLMSALEIERLLINGFTGKTLIPEDEQRRRRALAYAEVEYFARLIGEDPIGIQIGLVTGTLPQAGFQIFRQQERKILSISPFRLGEHPNVRVGVAMITSAPEALLLHEKAVKDMWSTALKGHAASAYLRDLLAATEPQARSVRRISSI